MIPQKNSSLLTQVEPLKTSLQVNNYLHKPLIYWWNFSFKIQPCTNRREKCYKRIDSYKFLELVFKYQGMLYNRYLHWKINSAMKYLEGQKFGLSHIRSNTVSKWILRSQIKFKNGLKTICYFISKYFWCCQHWKRGFKDKMVLPYFLIHVLIHEFFHGMINHTRKTGLAYIRCCTLELNVPNISIL